MAQVAERQYADRTTFGIVRPEKQGILRRARETMANISEKSMISWGVAVVLVAIALNYAGGQAEAKATKELVLDLKADVKDIATRMMTRDQVDDLIARRLAESKVRGG